MDFIVESALKQQAAQSTSITEVKQACIKVFGSGGAGNNMVGWLYQKGIKGAEIIATNTDQQHLNMIEADRKFLIGTDITKGLGCGGFPEKGFESAKESIQEIKDVLKGSDMVFVCAGMGGGTGTGSAPVIAQVAKDTGAIVIGTVTMPFRIERARVEKAEFGLSQLRKACDTVIVIDNNRLVQIAGNLPIGQAFAVANELISTMIKGIVETIAVPSLVNLDYADVRSIMENGGIGMISVGDGKGIDKVAAVTESTRKNKLLDIDMTGAKNILVHITGGTDLTIADSNDVVAGVTKGVDNQANVIMGARIDPSFCDKIETIAIYTKLQHKPILAGAEMDKPKEEDIYYHPPPNLLR